ncbi:MAG: peptidylprolyl isomerase [Gammaproteobacteria bacterium]|nr:peptidylprolyl isomerase [Gammaproteobacteria bacterium]NNL50556.1 peptidylprolyl isomerase [Woeseiaceae bacterium]
MISKSGSGIAGKRPVFFAAGALFAMLAGPLSAEPAANINGVEISAEVLDTYLETRTQKPAASASADERSRALTELTDIYLLTTQPRATEISRDAKTKAQIELQSRGIIARAVAADYLANNAASDAEIKAAYEAQVSSAPPLEFKARHILVETQGEAVSLIKELEDGGDFATLAKEKSTGPSGANGGDLGWFSANQMVAPFSNAVAALPNGQFSKEPVQTQFGWHVILREDSRESTPPTLESLRGTIKQRVEQEKLQNYLESLRATLEE